MKFLLALLAVLILAQCASAQNVSVIGPVTSGNLPQFNSPTVIKDSGVTAASIPTGLANPTGAVGLSAVNGAAATAMRSDAAPPLSGSVQSSLTGTSNQILLGTSSFGFAALGSLGTTTTVLHGNAAGLPSFSAVNLATDISGTLPLANGGLGGSQAAATLNQIPVYPGGGGAAVPTTIGGTGGLFDTICSSTIGQTWVRLSSGWGCTSFGYANPVWWGADPTGVADSTSAFNSALAASTDVRFPRGKFKFLSAITYNFAAGIVSVTIQGAGEDNTILTWPNAAGGITFNYAGFTSSVHIRDLSFTTGTTAGGDAIKLSSTVSNNNSNFAFSDFYRITCRGDDGYNVTDYWTNCINVVDVSDLNFDSLNVFGPSSANGTGINLIGATGTSTYSVVINIAKSSFFANTTGINYGSFVQGVTVDQCNFNSFSGSGNGIVIPASQTGTLDQLSVTNSQFNETVNAVSAGTAINHLLFSNNLIFLPANAVGLNLVPATGFNIIGNYITSLSVTGTFGINLAGNSTKGTIANNIITGAGTGINVQAGTNNINVLGNTLLSNTTNIGYGATATTNFIVGNPGYNPVGPATISVGASPFTYTAGVSPETVYIFSGTVTGINFDKNGGALGTVACQASPCTVDLGPFEQVKVTYSSAPAMNKMIH